MNDLEYLNQISVKPAAAPQAGFFDKKTKLIAIILGAVFLLAIILMIVSSASKPSSEPTETSELTRVYYQSLALEQTVSTYNKQVKSSDLRSTGASLASLLAEIRSTTGDYMTSVLGLKAPTNTNNMLAADLKVIEATNTALETARLNGILDRKYASELSYQISRLILFEHSAANKTSNSQLKSYLESSQDSLETINKSLSSTTE